MIQSVETHATMAEAQRAMGADAIFMAGGTLVMRDVNAGVSATRLVRSTDPALTDIRLSGDGVTIGAGVTMTMIAAHRDVAFLAPVARAVGGPQVRNMATVGGNLFAPHPYGDFAVALLALGARVAIAGQSGAARPLADVLRNRDRAGLVTSIQVPRPQAPADFAFLKVSRIKPKGASVLSVAAHLPRQGGRIRGARVAFGAMGPMPLQAAAVERVLEGQSLDAATIARAAQVAADGLDPPTDALASAWYRREVAGVHLKRLLERMARG
ncbi:MAG: FAD binding domain-containing protein [Hyphomicrobiaceae bacterium]|nr:FAD binding domain-containing protein [Hyphomicrobiaceae bacterium]